MTHRGAPRFLLPQWARRGVYGIAASCLLTGLGWLWLHHFVIVDGEFGPEASPFEHPALIAHGIAASAMTWLFGLLWLAHVRRAWHARRNRRSGGTMVALLGWLCLSGLGLYYIGNDAARVWIANGHWVAGLIAGVWLPIHIWRGRRAVRSSIRNFQGAASP
jgi:hypothetical protein